MSALLPVPLLLSGCVDSSGGEFETDTGTTPAPEGEATGPREGVVERGERGGPEETGDGEEALRIGGVKTEATAGDTVELFTRGPVSEESAEAAGSAQVEWVARLSLTFTSAERGDDGVTFHGTASYLPDEGAYTLHSKDFTVLVPEDSGSAEAETFEDGYRSYTSGEDETLVTLTSGKPTREFSVTVADVPPEEEAQRYADGTTGRYVQYETPGQLWGHEVQVPQDYVPGRLCYVEGNEWHDVGLFEFSDIPCG